jgi:hypothetical protein
MCSESRRIACCPRRIRHRHWMAGHHRSDDYGGLCGAGRCHCGPAIAERTSSAVSSPGRVSVQDVIDATSDSDIAGCDGCPHWRHQGRRIDHRGRGRDSFRAITSVRGGTLRCVRVSSLTSSRKF